MTTTYKEPNNELDQQFEVTPEVPEVPTLYGCIIAPGYQLVEDKESGAYAGLSAVFPFLDKVAGAVVDTRTEIDDEVVYPVKVGMKDAYVVDSTQDDGTASINIAGTYDSLMTSVVPEQPFTMDLNANPWYVKMYEGIYENKILNTVGAGDIALVALNTYSMTFASACLQASDIGKPIVYTDAVSTVGYGTITVINDARTVATFTTTGTPVNGAATLVHVVAHTFDCETTGTAAGVAPSMTLTFSTACLKASDIGKTITLTDFGSSVRTGTITGVDVTRKIATASIASCTAGAFTVCSITGSATTEWTTSDTSYKRIQSTTSSVKATVFDVAYGILYSRIKFTIIKKIAFYWDVDRLAFHSITVDKDTGVTIPVNVTSPEDKLILEGTVKMCWRAVRETLFDTHLEITSASDISDNIGAITKANTGAWMAYMAYLGSNGRTVYFTGCDERYFGSDSEKTAMYGEIYEYLVDFRVYGKVQASMDPDMNTLLNSHVNACSTEELCKWCVGLISRFLITYENIQASRTSGNTNMGLQYEGFSGLYVGDAGADFFTAGAGAADLVNITAWGQILPKIIHSDSLSTIACTNTAVGLRTESTLVFTSYDIVTVLGLTSISDIVGKHLMVNTNTGDANSDDIALYEDYDHLSVPGIGTGDKGTFENLGYRIKSAAYDGTDTTLVLEMVGQSTGPANMNFTGNITDYDILDSVLTTAQEAAILATSYVVDSVTSQTRLKMTTPLVTSYTGNYSKLTYTLDHPWTKTEQAQYISNYAAGLGNRRMRLVWPDVHEDDDGVTNYAYFIAAYIAGKYSYEQPHQGFTRMQFTGVAHKLLHSNKYFKRTQMNELATGGVQIYTQLEDGLAITCRHQLTTNTTTVIYQEDSATRSIDTASFLIIDVLDPLIGKFNITPDLFSTASTLFDGVQAKIVDKKYPKIGSILKNLKVVSISNNGNDRVSVEWSGNPQIPCNGFDNTLTIRSS